LKLTISLFSLFTSGIDHATLVSKEINNMFNTDRGSKMAAYKIGIVGAMCVAASILSGCGGAPQMAAAPSVPVDIGPGPKDDGYVVRGVALYTISNEQQTALMKLFNLAMPTAYAATGSTTVTYVNAASVNFSINVSNFAAGSFTGNTLSLGHVDLGSIDDNNLKVCGAGGNSKCSSAVIRVYTTGSIAGFVNTADGYGAPVYAGSLNPSTAVGLTSANSVQVQTYTIPSSDHRITTSDFASTQYAVSSDFANAGAGSYSMTFVVEYALAP
jgi:hypothetical protein